MKHRLVILLALALPIAVLAGGPATADNPEAGTDRVAAAAAPAGEASARPATASPPNPLAGLAGNGAPAEAGRKLSAAEKQILGPGHWHSTPRGKTWYGAYLSLTGYNAYCVDAGLRTPRRTYFAKADTRRITSARTAYLLSAYSDSPGADTHAALSAVAKLDKKIPHRHRVPVSAPAKLGKKFAGTAKRYKAMKAEAAKLAGPYRLTLTLGKPVRGAKGATTATVSVLLRSASGAAVPGYRVKLAKTAGSLSRTTLTTGATPVRTTLRLPTPKAATNTTATVKARAVGLPSTKLVLYKPTGNGSSRVQNIVTKGSPIDVAASARITATGPAQPRVTTTIGSARMKPGASVWDTFTVAGLATGQRVDVNHTLWRVSAPPTRSARRPDGARQVGSVVSKGVGNGTGRSPGITLPKDFHGWVYWTEKITAGPHHAGWQSDHGIPDETGLVPWTPAISTRAELDAARSGTTDTISVTGGRPGTKLHLTARLFHTDEKPSRQAQPDGTRIATQKLTITLDDKGDGSVRTRAVRIKPGWASWVANLEAGQGWDAWTSEFGIPEETVHLSVPTIPAVPPATMSSPPTTSPTTVSPTPAPSTTTPVPGRSRSATTAPAAAPPRTSEAAPAAAAPPGAELPRTGSQATVFAGFGLLLVGLGMVATVLTSGHSDRKKRR